MGVAIPHLSEATSNASRESRLTSSDGLKEHYASPHSCHSSPGGPEALVIGESEGTNWGSFVGYGLASCFLASDRHSNDSLETISAVFPRDRGIRSQTNDRIPFRAARADSLPPVAAHSSARHKPQTTKIDLFVYMRVSLQDDADVIV